MIQYGRRQCNNPIEDTKSIVLDDFIIEFKEEIVNEICPIWKVIISKLNVIITFIESVLKIG